MTPMAHEPRISGWAKEVEMGQQAPIDVLAVMDRHIRIGCAVSGKDHQEQIEARAAVAELIAVVTAERDELRDVDNGKLEGHSRSRMERVIALSAALARVGGAA